MKRKFIAITVLICVLGCLCSCTQKDVTPTSAPTAQQTTEAPKKTLTADEVVALIHDKFDTEKENCRFEEISSGTSVTVYEDGTSEKENTGKNRTAFKKENGKISFRLDVESGSDGQPFNIIQAYQSGWAKALEYSTYGGYSGVSFEDLSAYWGAQCTILDDYSSCEITNDGENTVYTFSFEDSESGLEINEPDDGSVFQSKTKESQMKKVVVLDKDNMPIYYIASGVTEGNYGGKKQTTTYSTRFDWSFENVEIDFSDLSDYLYLATGEKKQ